jgi:long-subunit acyl-CoA synthetase (AMP-forming)
VTSLPARLLDAATATPDRVAFRRKVLGVWEETTYAEYARRAAAIGTGLVELGVGPGDHVAIASENRPEWLFVDLAVQGIGASTVGLPPAAPEEDIRNALAGTSAVAVVVEDELQLDKVLDVRGALPALRHVIVLEPPARIEGTGVIPLTGLEPAAELDGQAAWRNMVEGLDPSAAAAVVYTTGATDVPRAVHLSHTALVTAADTVVAAHGIRAADEVLSPLPLAHVANRILSGAVALVTSAAVHFGEAGPTFAIELREVQPSVFLAPPRVWEQLYASTEFRVRDATRLKRAAYRFGVAGGGSGLAKSLRWLLLHRSLREKLGMARVRVALSTGGPIAPRVVEWLTAIGVPVSEMTGELVGVSNDGRLSLDDRAAAVIELAGGTEIDPAPVEAQLTASPFIRDALLVGTGRPHVTALIGVEPVTVGAFVSRDGAPAGSVAEMIRRDDVVALIDQAVDEVNTGLAREARITAFRLLPTELDEESGLLTSTFQVRRDAVVARFVDLVESMYATEAAR